MGPVLVILGAPFLAFLGSSVAAWRGGTRTVVPAILLGYVLSSLLLDVSLRDPEMDAAPVWYLFSFILYAVPFLLLAIELWRKSVSDTLTLAYGIYLTVASTINILLCGMFALGAFCRLGLWQDNCAEVLAVF